VSYVTRDSVQSMGIDCKANPRDRRRAGLSGFHAIPEAAW